MQNLIKEVRGNHKGLGVYCFKDANEKVLYVGSGMMNDRLSAHLHNLKRGLYEGTNKEVLQKEYNYGNLIFEVIHYSANNTTYLNGTKEERDAIQQSLEVLEQFYYELNKNTVCNKISTIYKRSTSPTKEITERRRKKNTGSNNPNKKYDENLIAEILYLKEQGLKAKEIMELLIEQDIDIHKNYISALGVYKWIYLKSKCPEWYKGA